MEYNNKPISSQEFLKRVNDKNTSFACDSDIYGSLAKCIAHFAPTPFHILMKHNELDDFLQNMVYEGYRHWINRTPEDIQDMNRFIYFYCKRPLNLKSKLKGGINSRLIAIRAVDYTRRLINKNQSQVSCDMVIMENLANRQQLKVNLLTNFNDPYLTIKLREELTQIKAYLENTNCTLPIVKYFELLVRQYEYQEIVDYFGLSKKATSKIQEALRYYLNKYMGHPRYKSIYEEKRKEQESKKIDPVSILEVV